MADKRRSSKQRRQARNRAQRDALAARTEAAGKSPASAAPAAASSQSSTGRTGPTYGSGSASPGAEGGAAADTSTVGGAGRRGGGLLGLRGRRRPGDLAVTLALAFALASLVSLVFFRVPVDDRGEALPNQFRGLTLEVRSMLEGRAIEADSEGVFTVFGPSVLLLMFVPVIVAGGAFWANRTQPRRSRNLTIAMVLMAVVVIFSGSFGTFYMPSLIALAVGSFQVRKHEMPFRPGQRPGQRPAPRQRDDEVIDVDEVETDEERALAELEEELSQEGDADAPEQGNGSRPR